jgi:hypothetical protein
MPASSGPSGRGNSRPGAKGNRGRQSRRAAPTDRPAPEPAAPEPAAESPAEPATSGKADFFAPILAACAPIAELTTAFDAELAVSALLGGAYSAADRGREAAVGRFVDDLVEVLAERRDALSGALLAGLSAIAPAEPAGRAAAALEAGVPAPPWAGQVGRVRLTGAWAMSDVYGDQTEYILIFEYLDSEVGGPPHAVCVLADHGLGVVKDCWLSLEPDGIIDDCRRSAATEDDLILGEVDAALARTVIRDLFAETDELSELPESTQLAEERGAVLARVAALPSGGKAPDRPGPDERAVLVDDFLAAPEGQLDGPDAEVVAVCTQLLVDYAADRGAGDPLRWSPRAVEIFLVDWAPRSAVIDDECVRWLPVVLDAFISYAGRRTELPDAAVSAARQAVTEHAGDFAEQMASGASEAENAAQVARQLIADGVDPTDPAAVQAWLKARFSPS